MKGKLLIILMLFLKCISTSISLSPILYFILKKRQICIFQYSYIVKSMKIRYLVVQNSTSDWVVLIFHFSGQDKFHFTSKNRVNSWIFLAVLCNSGFWDFHKKLQQNMFKIKLNTYLNMNKYVFRLLQE